MPRTTAITAASDCQRRVARWRFAVSTCGGTRFQASRGSTGAGLESCRTGRPSADCRAAISVEISAVHATISLRLPMIFCICRAVATHVRSWMARAVSSRLGERLEIGQLPASGYRDDQSALLGPDRERVRRQRETAGGKLEDRAGVGFELLGQQGRKSGGKHQRACLLLDHEGPFESRLRLRAAVGRAPPVAARSFRETASDPFPAAKGAARRPGPRAAPAPCRFPPSGPAVVGRLAGNGPRRPSSRLPMAPPPWRREAGRFAGLRRARGLVIVRTIREVGVAWR